MTISEFIRSLNQFIPLDLAMPDDPVGLQVMAEERTLSNVGVAYELNSHVIELAAQANAELIVAFHPLIYPHLKRIVGSNRVERSVVDLIDRRIALYVLHTAFDAHPEGTSVLLATALGCTDILPLSPHPHIAGAGMGAIGTLGTPLSIEELAERVKNVCNAEVVRISGRPEEKSERTIKKIGVLGGSGMSFYNAAVAAGADAFITADVRYHSFHAANDSVPVLDPGHAESEAFVVDGMAKLIERHLQKVESDIAVLPITLSTNPVRYIV